MSKCTMGAAANCKTTVCGSIVHGIIRRHATATITTNNDPTTNNHQKFTWPFLVDPHHLRPTQNGRSQTWHRPNRQKYHTTTTLVPLCCNPRNILASCAFLFFLFLGFFSRRMNYFLNCRLWFVWLYEHPLPPIQLREYVQPAQHAMHGRFWLFLGGLKWLLFFVPWTCKVDVWLAWRTPKTTPTESKTIEILGLNETTTPRPKSIPFLQWWTRSSRLCLV